jgi:hypothetical protein
MALERFRYSPGLQGLVGAAAGQYARQFVNTMRQRGRSSRIQSLRSRIAGIRVASGGGAAGYRSRRVPRSRFRVRYKSGRSRTSTMTRTRRRRGGRRGRFGKKRMRKASGFTGMLWRKLCTPMTYKSTVAFAQAGSQALRTFISMMIGGESIMKVIGAKHPSNFLFNTALGSASTATLQDPGGYNYKLVIDKYLWNCRVQNRSNASMELKVYECLVRHDIPTSGTTTALNALNIYFQDAVAVPTFVGQVESNLAPGQAANPTGVTDNFRHPGFTPYMSNEFTQTFRILKTRSIEIPPNHIVPMKFNLRKKTVNGQWLQSGVSFEWQKGWSKVILFSWVGMPIDDGTTANQSKAKTDLFVQADIYIKYHFLPGGEPLVNLSWQNDVNAATSGYSFNPAGFTAVIPASDTIQTVAGSAAAAADTVAAFAP